MVFDFLQPVSVSVEQFILKLSNQTLPANALNLHKKEKENLIHFMNALNSPVSNY